MLIFIFSIKLNLYSGLNKNTLVDNRTFFPPEFLMRNFVDFRVRDKFLDPSLPSQPDLPVPEYDPLATRSKKRNAHGLPVGINPLCIKLFDVTKYLNKPLN